MNLTGPRHDPCGTPWSRSNWSDTVPLIVVHCDLDSRQENKFSAVSETPKVQFMILNKMLWSKVSKSDNKSIKTSCVTFC